jgi:hypothetical protein
MMTSDAKRALAKTIRELREKIILPDLREATERAYPGDPPAAPGHAAWASALRVPRASQGPGPAAQAAGDRVFETLADPYREGSNAPPAQPRLTWCSSTSTAASCVTSRRTAA